MGIFFAKEYKIDENNLYDFINKLMRGVFSKIDFVDLFSMMDPEQCKDYIIFGEKNIQKIFIKMNLRLGRDNEDKIYIRKASTLREKLGQEDVHKLACRDVAKFIAQILRLIATIIFMLKISKPVKEPLENIGASATGQIFAERDSGIFGRLSDVFSSFPLKKGQSGGAYNFKIDSRKNLTVTGITPQDLFLKYFILNKGTVQLEKTQTNNSSLITLQQDQLRLNGCVTGTALPPTPAPPTPAPASPGSPFAPPRLLLVGKVMSLSEILSSEQPPYTCSGVLNNPNEENPNKYVMRYKFNLDKQTKYAFSFDTVFITEGTNTRLVMDNFEWEENATPQDASDLRRQNAIVIRCMVNTEKSKLVVFDGRGITKDVHIYIYDKCKEIESESWNNPDEDRASKYLILWRYLLPEQSSEPYVVINATNELLFEEASRNRPKGTVLYKKPVQLSNRSRRDITFACDFSIENKGLQSDGQYLYSLTVHNIRMETIIQGINFDPISELEPRNFTTRTRSNPPTDTQSNTVPQYLKQVLSKNIVRTGATGHTYRYVRDKVGERMYRIPETTGDLGKLQSQMLSFDTLPACSARARELLTKIGDNRYLSSVCNTKFRHRVNGSLPKTKEITGSYGIDALHSLFKFIDDNVPNVNSTKEWEEFKQNMQKVGGYDLRAKCDKKFGDGMELPLDVASDVRGVVEELVAMEQAKVSSMLDLLFQIISRPALDEGGEIKLNERLFEEGMPRVIVITGEVIEAAKNYYILCDTTYNKALRRILDSQGAKVPENPSKGGPRRAATEENEEDPDEANNIRGEDSNNPQGPNNPGRRLPFGLENV